MSVKIGEQIALLRKQFELTQEELANKLNVSSQAVSKWEANKCCPNIELLPQIADLFSCSIDELFQRDKSFFYKGGENYELCAEFPWMDDEVIRGVVCLGRKILKVTDDPVSSFTFRFKGEALRVETECNLSVIGNIMEGCTVGGDLTVTGSVSGDCIVGNNISTKEIKGNVRSFNKNTEKK